MLNFFKNLSCKHLPFIMSSNKELIKPSWSDFVVDTILQHLQQQCIASWDKSSRELDQKWLNAIKDELYFWLWARSNIYANRYPLFYKIPIPYENYLHHIKKDTLSVLNVGSGPWPQIWEPTGSFKKVFFLAVDPLAAGYKTIVDLYNHELGDEKYPVLPYLAEDIDEKFSHGSFDVVFASNCLDHMQGPIDIVSKIFKLRNENGIVVLIHFEDEAKSENYHGMHQWNINFDGKHMVIWNKKCKHIVEHEKYNVNLICNSVKHGEREGAIEMVFTPAAV